MLWSAQGLYARAFYAAGDTLTPMVAVSVITVVSLPMYSLLFHAFGVVGLAWASDIGIGINLLALALLLHSKKLVSLGEFRWGELAKAAVVAVVAGGISFEVAKVVPLATSGRGSRVADLIAAGAGVADVGCGRGSRFVAAEVGIAGGFGAAQGSGVSGGGAGRGEGDFGRRA